MRFCIKLIMVVMLFSATAQAEETPTTISYDKEKDTLSLKVEDVSLKKILATII